jgi:hypothetical protein
MGRFSRAARSSVLVLSVAALLPVLGASAAGAATAPGAATGSGHAGTARKVTTVTWHKLRLLHGWKSSRSSTPNVANVAYAISGGVVYLDGTVHQPGGSNDEFAVLPRAARPRHDLFIPVFTGSGTGTPGTLLIMPDGSMRAYSGGAQLLTSLAAVSFPVAGTRWHALKLLNGWKTAIHNLGAAAPGYAVIGGVVHLTGSAAGGTLETELALLPKGDRPSHDLYLPVYNFGGTEGEILVETSGAVFSFGGSASSQVSLDSLSFPAAGARGIRWHKLPLTAAWASSQLQYETGDPAYAVVGPIVYLAGSMHFKPSVKAGSAIFSELPKAIRPVHNVNKLEYTYQNSTGGVTLAGIFGLASSDPASNAENYTSLAGFSFPRSS